MEYEICVQGVRFIIETPTKRLLTYFPPGLRFGPSVTPKIIRRELIDMGFKRVGHLSNSGSIWRFDPNAEQAEWVTGRRADTQAEHKEK